MFNMLSRLFNYSFRLYVQLIRVILHAVIPLVKSGAVKNKSVMALPYYPLNFPGGHERIANWKPYFEQEGIQFDVYWASDSIELDKYFRKGNVITYYYFFLLNFHRRLRLISKLKNYQTVWIQRSFIPYFPFHDAYFEEVLGKIHPNIIMDFYDADYVSNYNLVMNAVKYARGVTVSTITSVALF